MKRLLNLSIILELSGNNVLWQHYLIYTQGLERHLLGTHGLVTASMQDLANKGQDSGRCPVCGKVYQWKLLNHVAKDHMKVSLQNMFSARIKKKRSRIPEIINYRIYVLPIGSETSSSIIQMYRMYCNIWTIQTIRKSRVYRAQWS